MDNKTSLMVEQFLTSLLNMFKNAPTTHQAGIGECCVMTKELKDTLIKGAGGLLPYFYQTPEQSEVPQMNIKEKLIQQLSKLEEIQELAILHTQFDSALSASRTIMDYIRNIEMIQEEHTSPNECGVNDNYICPDCEEAMLKESLHQEIADTCGLPIELVNRVLAGQDEVFKDLD